MEQFANLFRADLFSQLGETGIVFTLILVRMLGFVHTAPVFSHKSVTGLTRTAIALFSTLLFVDIVKVGSPPVEGYFLPFIVLVNLFIGILIGFVASLMFHTVVAGGEMMDSSMGFSSGQMFDPSTGHQTTIVGRFMGMLSIVVFFYVRGPEALLKGLSNSFIAMPVYADEISMNIPQLITLTGDIITMGFIIVSPVVLTILVADLILGLVSRAAPQINAFQISFTIKPSIGNIIFILILPLFFSMLMSFFTSPSRYF